MMTHEEFTKKLLQDPKVQKEYEALKEEYTLLDELLNARTSAGLTQAEAVGRMGTKTPAAVRLEA